jgi:hypothetical protein
MERFPRGSLPPKDFPAVATVAPQAIAKAEAPPEPSEPKKQCDLSTTCPSCSTQMQPEHAHYKCPACGYRDSCCF